MFRFLTLLAFLEASTLVNGAASLIGEQCQPVTFPSGANHTLCFETIVTTPSPTNTGQYAGGYSVTYDYTKGAAAGIETYVNWEKRAPATECEAGEIGLEDITGEIIETACNSCTFCADGTVEADCTNLVKGRKVACGENRVRAPDSQRKTPFFPFVLGKLVQTTKPTMKPTMNMPTKKPTKTPTTKKPTKTPTTKKPTMKPTKKPTKTPTSLLSCYYNSSWKECQGNYPNPYTCDGEQFVEKVVCCRGDLLEGYLSSFGYCVAILD